MQYLEILLIGIFCLIFFYLNFKIIISDLRKKIIPNKILLHMVILIPFFYIYNYFFGTDSHDITNYILQALITIFAGFCLYLLGLWGAGDVKYLVVLGLFLQKYGFLPFVSNIGMVTVTYLGVYFIWFYLGKCLFIQGYAKSLYNEVYKDLRDKFESYIKYKDGGIHGYHTTRILLNWCIIFLCIFVGFRLIRLSIIKDFAGSGEFANIMKDFFKQYPLHMSILSFLIFWGIRYIFMIFIKIGQRFVGNYFKIKQDKTSLFFPFIMLFGLVSFIFFEYIQAPSETMSHLYKIFTFYVIIFVVVKILFYAYKITFQVAETYYIDIKHLKNGEIVDRPYLVNIFGKQGCLGAHGNKGILSPNPQDYFLKIENPVSSETVTFLKKIYKIVNSYHLKQKTAGFQKIEKIKLLKTFSLGPYIFLGFLITFLFGDFPAKIFLLKVGEFMHFLYRN